MMAGRGGACQGKWEKLEATFWERLEMALLLSSDCFPKVNLTKVLSTIDQTKKLAVNDAE